MKRSKQLLALMLMASALLLSAASSETPRLRATESESSQAQRTSPHAETNQQTAAPSVSPPASNRDNQTGGNADQSGEKERQYRLNRLLTWFNGFVALFTFALAVVSYFQWRAIKRQSDITLMIEAPWISVNFSSHVFDEKGAFNPRPWIEYWFENTGRTPGTLSHVCAAFKFVREIPPKPEYGEGSSYPPGAIVVPPNGGKTHPGTYPCDLPLDRKLLGDANYKYLFYGFARYSDMSKFERTVGFGFFAKADPKRIPGFFLIESAEYNYRYERRYRWYQRLHRE